MLGATTVWQCYQRSVLWGQQLESMSKESTSVTLMEAKAHATRKPLPSRLTSDNTLTRAMMCWQPTTLEKPCCLMEGLKCSCNILEKPQQEMSGRLEGISSLNNFLYQGVWTVSQIGKHTILGRERVSHGLNYKVTTTMNKKNVWQQNTNVNRGHLRYLK